MKGTWDRRTSKEMLPNVPDPSVQGGVLHLDPNPPATPCNIGGGDGMDNNTGG